MRTGRSVDRAEVLRDSDALHLRDMFRRRKLPAKPKREFGRLVLGFFVFRRLGERRPPLAGKRFGLSGAVGR